MATQTIPVNETEFSSNLPLDLLLESPYNARKLYNKTQLEELAASIKSNGIVQPIIVRPLTGNYYEVVAGSRRRRAAMLAGLDDVPVIMRNMSDEQAREISLIENIQREDVHPMHEALGMQEALRTGDYDVTHLASRLGKHLRHVHKRLQLCRLIEEVQQSFIDGWWSLGAATEISKLTEEQQKAAYAHFFKSERQYTINEREVEGWISYNVLVVLQKAVFDLKDAELVPAAGACVGCPKRTGANPLLWEDTEKDQCTDPACFKVKVSAFLDRKREKLTKKHGAEGFVQISSFYRSRANQDNAAPAGIISSDKYKECEKDSCESAIPGLNVEGDIGKVKWVCTNPICPVHGKITTSTDPDKIRQKAAEKETALRGRIFQMILKRYPAQASRSLKEFIAVKFANRLSHDLDIAFAKMLKVETGKGMGINYPGYVKGLSDRELEIFMLAVALVPEAKVFTYGRLEREGPLFDLAKEFDVPIEQAAQYCDAYYHARTKRGNDRVRAMQDLPTDPTEVPVPIAVVAKKEAKPRKRTERLSERS